MPTADDQHAPRHPIRVVAQRVGVPPALIRAWETRYAAVTPFRTAIGERLYSDAEVKRLELLQRATTAGRRISQVAAMPDDELRRLVDEDRHPAASHAGLESLQGLDSAELAAALEDLALQLGPTRFVREVLHPVLQRLENQREADDSRRLLLAPRWQRLAGAAPELADLTAVRDLLGELGAPPGISAGQLHALLLVQQVLHYLLTTLQDRIGGENLLHQAMRFLEGRFGTSRVDETLRSFEELWGLEQADQEPSPAPSAPTGPVPPPPERSPEELFELLLLLWLANRNPAFASLRDLLDDAELEHATHYRELMASLDELFEGPVGGAVGELLDPAAPTATPEQALSDLVERHGDDLGRLRDQLQIGLGVLAEEQRLPFAAQPAPPPSAPAPPPPIAPGSTRKRRDPDPDALPPERWRLSTDREWMTNATLVAKHTLVWLDQLGRRFGTPITRLDEIPVEALEELHQQGFDALWLVGLWERSHASEVLARAAGRADAAASAYAVRNYEIAAALGGWEALDALAGRCRDLGLTLGCDLVPNHTAIDADWVIDRPELFVQLPRPPFPNYRFTGPDLSPDPRVEIRLEDGYALGTDAAVVFERREVASGEVRYLYHGNDGTGLPWKDTAQLDYTRADVRELMTEQICTIASHFRMIRFDAAMTLTRRHFQRLWYPAPGKGGAIPSRAEQGLAPRAFDQLMPREFWAEVVEQVAERHPDTMLVAEAFWLMEPYFVRELGIHRVYHSAFMHWLAHDRPGDLWEWIAAALEREPRELSRYVHFLTTPDEKPAAELFGVGDRYLAAATLLATLPGLPLFGHGQVEGLREKYGMEFSRAERDESADPGLVARHQLQLAPLLAQRRLFADPERLRLLEVRGEGFEPGVVWAFTNRSGDEGVLVVVALVDRALSATIGPSEPFRVPWGSRSCQLAEALGVPGQRMVVARDFFTNEETTLELDDDGTLGIALDPWGCRIWRIALATTILPPFPEPPTPPDLPASDETDVAAAEMAPPDAAVQPAVPESPPPSPTTSTRRRPRRRPKAP